MEPGHRVSRVSCCIVGCSNSYANTSDNIKFYRFSNKSYEKERKKIWINSVRRNLPHGKPWVPGKYDRICSVHFLGNCKSNIESDPSYNPTMFPEQYKMNKQACKSRLNRVQRRTAQAVTNVIEDCEVNTSPARTLVEISMKATSDFSCQANFPLLKLENGHQEMNFIFECDFSKESNDVLLQANITNHRNFVSTCDKCVGNTDDVKCAGFHGYKSISNEQEMNSISGVSFSVFNLFLTLLTIQHGNDKLSKENKLLLFLMKMKLGISYRVLSLLFNLHPSSISRIFLSLLNELVQKTENYIYWPARTVIQSTLPKVFSLHYADCRVIIDCSEVKIEHPKGVEKQVYTYSNYKGTFTAKFLIGIAPNGFITFLSKCYGGRATDSYITNDCGILELLESNDKVLADKGFPNIECKDNVIIVMPPFVHNGMLTVEEVEQTYSIASVRIHVERSIQRIKIYNILQKIPHSLFPYIDMVVRMCGILTNLQPPTLGDEDSDENV